VWVEVAAELHVVRGKAHPEHDVEKGRVFHVVEGASKVNVTNVDVAGVNGCVFHGRDKRGVAVENTPHAAEAVLCIAQEAVVFGPFTTYGLKDWCPEF
jgi:hypothetical protein